VGDRSYCSIRKLDSSGNDGTDTSKKGDKANHMIGGPCVNNPWRPFERMKIGMMRKPRRKNIILRVENKYTRC
jgi:hypothetical protein